MTEGESFSYTVYPVDIAVKRLESLGYRVIQKETLPPKGQLSSNKCWRVIRQSKIDNQLIELLITPNPW